MLLNGGGGGGAAFIYILVIVSFALNAYFLPSFLFMLVHLDHTRVRRSRCTLQAKCVRSPAIGILVTSINFSSGNSLRLVN